MTSPSPLPSPVPSPCIDICAIEPATGECVGCRRSLDEIARWSSMSEAQKGGVWARLRREHPGQYAPAEPPHDGDRV